MKFGKKLVMLLATSFMLLAGCDGKIQPSTGTSETPENYQTTVTDNFHLKRDYENKVFTEDGIGVATFRSHTDGDTTNWWVGTEKIKFRYLGVNTPESTAKMEPWGLPASQFTKEKTSKAKLIVLENDVEAYGRMDNNNARYLGFVWYSMDGDPANLRCLNLELIELGYSLNQIFEDTPLCPYYSTFAAAEEHARSVKIRIFGQLDPTFDYSDDVVTISLYELRANYSKYGKVEEDNEEGLDPSAGKQLRIRGLVVGMIGDNMILRDLQRYKLEDENGNIIFEQEEDDMLAGIYCYAGFNTSLAGSVSVGDVVFFYCRANKFNGTIQLSDIKTSFTDRKRPFIREGNILDNPALLEKYPEATVEPYDMDTSTFDPSFKNDTRYTDFKEYEGRLVKTRVTVRIIESGDYDEDGDIIGGTEFTSHYKEDASGNYTCYANSQAYYHSNTYGDQYLTLNIRVDGTQYPHINPTFFVPGHTYECYGYLSPYFDKYQLMLLNNTNPAYVVDLGVL
ncbi:MAG: thermonuclease family protein [Erysipelotrichales bacterium]|nr:thermonuclease family protein [Erysipelotrichales bacterium]